MENDGRISNDRFSFTIGRLKESRNRLRRLSEENRFRDVDEIWEAYCDVEEAIAIANFVLGAFDSVGKIRKLTVTLKDDPTSMLEADLRKKFSSIEMNLVAAQERFSKGMGDEGTELARRARDDLKIMLIGHARSERNNLRKSKTTKKN